MSPDARCGLVYFFFLLQTVDRWYVLLGTSVCTRLWTGGMYYWGLVYVLVGVLAC